MGPVSCRHSVRVVSSSKGGLWSRYSSNGDQCDCLMPFPYTHTPDCQPAKQQDILCTPSQHLADLVSSKQDQPHRQQLVAHRAHGQQP
jgi:hypothetical protein